MRVNLETYFSSVSGFPACSSHCGLLFGLLFAAGLRGHYSCVTTVAPARDCLFVVRDCLFAVRDSPVAARGERLPVCGRAAEPLLLAFTVDERLS